MNEWNELVKRCHEEFMAERLPLWLDLYQRGFKYKEIAQKVNRSPNTVTVAIQAHIRGLSKSKRNRIDKIRYTAMLKRKEDGVKFLQLGLS